MLQDLFIILSLLWYLNQIVKPHGVFAEFADAAGIAYPPNSLGVLLIDTLAKCAFDGSCGPRISQRSQRCRTKVTVYSLQLRVQGRVEV